MSALDGLSVSFRYLPDMIGTVQGDSYVPGTVRVQWHEPRSHTGVHKISDLVVRQEKETDEEEAAAPPG